MILNTLVAVSVVLSGWEGKPVTFDEALERVGYMPLSVRGVDPQNTKHRILWIPKGDFTDSMTGLKNPKGFLVLASFFSEQDSAFIIYQYDSQAPGFKDKYAQFGMAREVFYHNCFIDFRKFERTHRTSGRRGEIIHSIVEMYSSEAKESERKFEWIEWESFSR